MAQSWFVPLVATPADLEKKNSVDRRRYESLGLDFANFLSFVLL